eukprot:TRINITY_DN3090_c0_g1_i4.p1 TRINITY_DN3090_c0_g1~~TRINITY_DN3090_c0_g1_i4.p1  ORF type:complete len:503 (+),score=161.74 TRINITY_DN3090_c0_g1_i4:115-1623(+)
MDDDSLRSYFPSSFKSNKMKNKPRYGKKKNVDNDKGIEDSVDYDRFFPKQLGKKRKKRSKNRFNDTYDDDLDIKREKKKPKKNCEEEDDKEDTTERNDNEKNEELEENEDDMIGPVPVFEEGQEEVSYAQLPITNIIELIGHENGVTAMAIDNTGTRLITGSKDSKIKFWHFAGMKSNFQSFREIEPEEGHPIIGLSWNQTGSHFLSITGGLRPRLFTKEGLKASEFAKGDPYLHDMSNTKGHVASVNGVLWDPIIFEEFLTCSSDSTIRIWNGRNEKRHKDIIKVKNKRNGRTKVNCMDISSTGDMIACGTFDGSIQVFSRKKLTRPKLKNFDAHENEKEISSVKFSIDNQTIISRSCDNTLKIWDIRKFKQPLEVKHDIDNYGFGSTAFSPDGSMFLVGTSVPLDRGIGKLLFFDSKTFNQIHSIDISSSSVNDVLWHKSLNQIIVGCGDGTTRVFYDKKLSKKGVLLGLKKKAKKRTDGYAGNSNYKFILLNLYSFQFL